MAYITKEYLENNIKNYDQYRKLDKEGQANGIATLDANGKLSNSQIPVLPETHLAVAGNNSATDNAAVNSGTVYINTYKVTVGAGSENTGAISIAGKNGISVTADNSGKIEIIGQESGLTIENGEGLEKSDSSSTRTLNLKTATTDELGGVKVGNLGAEVIGDIQGGNSSQTIYPPPANGKYHPVETIASGDHSGHAVVKIPNTPSPFYEENTNDKFSVEIEEAKTATWANMNLFTFTDTADFNQKLEEYNRDKNDNDKLTANLITIKTNVYVTITCPTNVIFAQLDCPATIEGTLPLTVPVRSSTNDSGKQVISIKNNNVDTSFDGDSIKAGNPGYAYLRFTTEHTKKGPRIIKRGRTYNSTIQITYENGTYSSDIYF